MNKKQKMLENGASYFVMSKATFKDEIVPGDVRAKMVVYFKTMKLKGDNLILEDVIFDSLERKWADQ